MICKTVRYKPRGEKVISGILRVLPQKYTCAYLGLSEQERSELSEIRIRANAPCSFTVGMKNIIMRDERGGQICSSSCEIEDMIGKLCDGSVYSVESCINDGYIPFDGTRIGVCGTGIIIDGKYTGQHKITSLSVRIPVFTPSAADKVYDYIMAHGFEDSMGILAVAPPGFGKTTFLRALAAKLSDCSCGTGAKRVCIIDERGELYNKAMMENCLCDVISGIPKLRALEMAIRTMSPQVAVFDEIGSEEQSELLCRAFSGGVHIAASVHGNGMTDIMHSDSIGKAINKGVFSTVYLMNGKSAYGDGEIINVRSKVRS